MRALLLAFKQGMVFIPLDTVRVLYAHLLVLHFPSMSPDSCLPP